MFINTKLMFSDGFDMILTSIFTMNSARMKMVHVQFKKDTGVRTNRRNVDKL